MRNIIATVLAGVFFGGSTAFADVIHHCEPTEPSKEIGWIQISADRSGSESFAIYWTSPVGREDVEETEAEPIDDFTVTGYYSEKMNAALMFYTEDDMGGERTVLELDGREIPVICKGRN